MAASFTPTPPGVAGDQQREQRGAHAVLLQGECTAVLDIVPELALRATDAPPPGSGHKLVPYSFLAWLVLPALVIDPDDLPIQPHVWRFIVAAPRIGQALLALLTQ